MNTQKPHGMAAPFYLHQVINRNIPDKYDGEFNHYTSPVGLNGILNNENPSLWFTHVDYLNDKSEGTYLFNVFRKVLEDCIEIIDHETYEGLQSITDTDSLVTMEYFEDGLKKSKTVKADASSRSARPEKNAGAAESVKSSVTEKAKKSSKTKNTGAVAVSESGDVKQRKRTVKKKVAVEKKAEVSAAVQSKKVTRKKVDSVSSAKEKSVRKTTSKKKKEKES